MRDNTLSVLLVFFTPNDLYWNYHYEKTRYKISNLLEDGKEASEKHFLGGGGDSMGN